MCVCVCLYVPFNCNIYVQLRRRVLPCCCGAIQSRSSCKKWLHVCKVSYSIQHTSPTSADTPKDFYLKPDNEGTLKLSRTHKYFFQVQGQMAVFEHKYTYFVCWTPQGLHLEQIEQDQQFFSSIERTLDYFFLNVILPAFLGGECTENQCQSPSSKKQKPL